MIVRFTRRAEADLVQIVDYVAAISPEGALNVAFSLREAIHVIADHPLARRKTQRPMVFVKIVPRYPNKIFYRLRHTAIEIVHIRHASRRPWIA
jgi:toxin ParE1/3/4